MLEITFLRFAHFISKWEPPGRMKRELCSFCTVRYAWLADYPVVRDLPHDLAHELVWDLHMIFNDIYAALLDQEEAERLSFDRLQFDVVAERQNRLLQLAHRAERDVLDALDQHLDELEHVRVTVLEPKLDAYIRAQLGEL